VTNWHRPLRTVGWSWCLPIVARGHEDRVNGSPSHHSPQSAGFKELRQQKARKTDPAMVALLAEVEFGRPVRVPLMEGQSARGLRTAISRAATNRGLSVETVDGDGFVAVRKVDEPRARKPTHQTAEPGKRRGRPRKRQDHSLDEVLAAADNERIVPEPVIET
jgi:hypothetical protein